MIMSKIPKKIILVLIFCLISCIIFTSTAYASSPDDLISSPDDLISSADDFLKKGEDDAISLDALKNTSNYIYNTLLVIAVAIAVIVGSYLGIKFMLESAEDKAKIKEAMIPFVVGCFVIFGAFGIWKIAVNVGTSISGDSTYVEQEEPEEKYNVPVRTECPWCGEELGSNPLWCSECNRPTGGVF